MKRILVISALICTATAWTAASGQDYPNLIDTWIGTTETIIAGETNHHRHDGPGLDTEPRMVSVPLSIVINQQTGRRFSGSVHSDLAAERIVGAITSAGRILWVDEDGYTEAVLLDEDTMEVCYLLVQPTVQLASCVVVARAS
jgi:hypothetical protein